MVAERTIGGAARLGGLPARPRSASTGTGAIVHDDRHKPLLDPEISNVAHHRRQLGALVLLETGGDGMRWAGRLP